MFYSFVAANLLGRLNKALLSTQEPHISIIYHIPCAKQLQITCPFTLATNVGDVLRV